MKRGYLRVYLGYAAGVGKTMAMLGEGHRRKSRGTDVVVGFLETHGRTKTAEAIGDLEVMPRLRLVHRGTEFEEMDVDAILARAPAVVLVDELAHTNVPGSRHEKRWRDVEALLDAGITVISTVNVQHLESLNDVVERITGAKQRETIPDEIVRRADQLELVDMSPWSLRRRMAHGNVYPAEKIDAALSNYFREGNLTALRELALLWVADRVDEALLDYMEDHGITGPWETRERVVVAIAGKPSDLQLIRRGARMAARRGGDLLAVHVVSGDGLAGGRTEALGEQQLLLKQLGGVFHEVVGGDVPRALLQFARAENATQVVLSASTRSRWAELTRGSVVNRVVRESGSIDVHVISRLGSEETTRLPATRAPSIPLRRRLIGLAIAAAGLPLLTVVLTSLREQVSLAVVLLLYLSMVVVIATVGGWWPAIAGGIAASLVVNWFFTEPLHTFTIASTDNVVSLVVFVLVAAVISVLVDLAATSRSEALRGRAEAGALVRMAGSLLEDEDPLPSLADRLRVQFGLTSVTVLHHEAGGWRVETSSGPAVSTPEGASETFELADDAVLALDGPRLPAEDRRVLAAFVTQLSLALRARRLRAEAESAGELQEANELRTAILAAVSHDLRSPLASIKASVTSLRQRDVAWTPEETEEFLATIEEEADRLNSLVGNLLDASRLQAGALNPAERPIGLDEVVPRALDGLHAGERRVEIDVPESLSRVNADPALLERAVANVVGNALTWSPADRAVRVVGSEVAGRVELRVVDRGPGVKASDALRMFEPFQRLGDRPRGNGVGLGLAVAKGFVEAMGGTIAPEDTPGGGLTMVITLDAVR